MPGGSWGGNRCQPPCNLHHALPTLPCNLLHPDAASKPLLSKFWNVPEWLVELKLLQLDFVNLVKKLGWQPVRVGQREHPSVHGWWGSNQFCIFSSLQICGSQPVGQDPSGSRTTLSQGSHIRYPAHQIFTLRFITVAKITVLQQP